MSAISGFSQAVSSLFSRSEAKPAAKITETSSPNTTSLSGQSASNSSPASSSRVTEAQGHAARMALGSGASELSQGGLGGGPAATSKQTNTYDTTLKTKSSEPLNPGDKASRLEDLRTFSQRDDDDLNTTNDRQRCAATSLTAAAYHSNGIDGLRTLMDSCDKFSKDNKGKTLSENGPDFSAIRQKLKDGIPLTKGDLSQISEGVHTTLRDSQFIGEQKHGLPALAEGVSPGGVHSFLNSDAAKDLKQTLSDNGAALLPVDASGNGKFDHWVAKLGPNNFVEKHTESIYDPESVRKFSMDPNHSGLSQVTSDEAVVARYADSSRRAVKHIQTGVPQPPAS